jgi:hypothetical protein
VIAIHDGMAAEANPRVKSWLRNVVIVAGSALIGEKCRNQFNF